MTEAPTSFRETLRRWFQEQLSPSIEGGLAPWLGANLGPWFEENVYYILLGAMLALLVTLGTAAQLLRRRATATPEAREVARAETPAALRGEPAASEPLSEPTESEVPTPAAEPAPLFRLEPDPVLAPIRVPEPATEDVGGPLEIPSPEPEPEVEPAEERKTEPARQLELISEPEPVAEVAPEPAPSRVRLRDRLSRTSQALVGRLGGILSGRTVDEELLEDLESLLFTSDLGVSTAESLLEEVRNRAAGGSAEKVKQVLRDAMLEKLEKVDPAPVRLSSPHVILVLGVNGSGKTTTIGKLAARLAGEGKRVLLGAGDTFRAAAIEQLQVWGERSGCEVIAGQPGGDPAAVAFDTVKAAIARNADVAIIDTAGRLQTKQPLMEELAKIARVIGRDIPEAPHECLLVLDSNTGQNAISQARLFTEVTTVTGLVLTKLDGTAKGGVVVGLVDEFGIPIKYVGVGEGVEDLRDFDAREFVDALFQEEG